MPSTNTALVLLATVFLFIEGSNLSPKRCSKRKEHKKKAVIPLQGALPAFKSLDLQNSWTAVQ